MSQGNVETVRGVRIPLVPETRQHRTLEERIFVRFPGLTRRVSAAWAQLPRTSRLRRVLLVRRLRQGYAAANRRDFTSLLSAFDPGIELHTRGMTPDMDAIYHGHDGYRQAWRVLLDAFTDVRIDATEVLDLGDRFLVTIEWIGHGAESGVSVSQPGFQLFTPRRGLVIREQHFFDRTEALQAAGLNE
jgi:ketosteroid isomerase-like protein